MADDKKPAPAQPPEMEAELPLPQPKAKPDGTNPGQPEKSDQKKITSDSSSWQRLRGWYIGHKKLSIPLTVLLFLLLLLAIPFTRYPLVGLALKKNLTIQVLDSTTITPVSGADVRSGSASSQTDSSGKATLKLKPGNHTVTVSKKYYRDQSAKVLVPVLKSKAPQEIKIQATGRQVKINVKNSITKNALPEVNIKVSDITAKTDKEGNALVVLPAGSATQKATLALSGYNGANVTVKVSEAKVEENEFTITPSGKIYFLSKLSGKIDVVKSNLDGSQRETVLAGTGREDNSNTVLLASHDWKYLALLSRRDSDLAKLYLIETSNDKVTAIDEGNADFNFVGWSDNNFVYTVDRKGYQYWQPNQKALKSLAAPTRQINVLDQSRAEGTSNLDWRKEYFGPVHLANKRAVYHKYWGSMQYSGDLADNGKQMGIYSVAAGGGSVSTHKTFSYEENKSTYADSVLASISEVQFEVIEKDSPAKYFVYTNNQVSEDQSIKDEFASFQSGGQSITYLQSPSGNLSFWAESRDGKNTLFLGDSSASNGKQIATLSDLQPYGWFNEDYLLASKNGSELYILGKEGIKKDAEALKVTDYHKPTQSYYGYGGM